MSEEAKRYNGWTNYETWCVHLWLTNEEGSYRYWREQAYRHRRGKADESWQALTMFPDLRDAARYSLSGRLKEELKNASPLTEASLFSDLLTSALDEVDWDEIADAFLEEVEPEDEPDPGEEDEESDQADEEEEDSAEDFESVKRERIESPKGPLFELGQVVSTPGALSTLTRQDMEKALARHHQGDWGEVGRHDWRANEEALTEGFRLFSVYRTEEGEKFWVITEADRSSTCVLLPEEY